MSAGIEAGDVVVSAAGHDSGTLLVVLEQVDGTYVLVADGKTRKLEKPKKKKFRHVKLVQKCTESAPVWSNNAQIRKFLKMYEQNRR